MYIVLKPGLQLSKRAAQVVAICEAGGFVRYALETGYGGREEERGPGPGCGLNPEP